MPRRSPGGAEADAQGTTALEQSGKEAVSSRLRAAERDR